MTESNDEKHSEGDTNLRISETEGIGIHIEGVSSSQLLKLDPMARIIKVDGTPIKGLPIDTVRVMLRGPIGTKATLEILTIQGQLVHVVLERQKITTQKPDPDPTTATRNASELLDAYDGSAMPSTYQNSVSDCERAGLEPFASALTCAAISLSDNWFDKNSVTAMITLSQAAEYFDRVGRISEADDAIERAITAIKHMDRSQFWVQRILLSFARHLTKTGRAAAAATVYEQLKICAERSDGPTDRQLEVLRPYAKFLAEQGKRKEAETAYDQIVALSQDRQSSNELQLAADFYAENGQLEKAINTYQDFTKAAEARWTETQRNYDRDRPLVHALYKLACVQQRASNIDAAIETLKKGLSVYTNRLDESKQIETERMPLFFPTVSDVDVKIAELLYKSKDFNSSVVHLQAAANRIEKSLGSETPYLRQPLLELARSYEALGNSVKAKQLTERAGRIQQIAETVGEQKQDDYQVSALCYKSIKAKDYSTTDGAIEKLLAVFEASSAGDENQRKRIRAWNCLTYIGTLLMNAGRYDVCRRLFDRMADACSRRGHSSALLNAVLTEKSIFAKELGLSSEDCWRQLEESLTFQPTITNPASESDLPSKQRPDFPVHEKLRRWALAYYYCGDYKRADSILQRAQSVLAVVTTGDVLSTELEITPSSLADMAMIDLRCSKFDAARVAIDAILSDTRNIGPSMGKKLIQLAVTYEQIEHATEAKQLLRDAIKKGIYSTDRSVDYGFGIPGLYRWKLAKLLAKDGELQQARKLIDEAQEMYKTLPPPMGFSVFSGEISYALGHYAEAARQYLSVQKSITRTGVDPSISDLRKQVLERALAAADKTEELSLDERAAIVKNLAECLGLTNPHESADLYERALAHLPSNSKESAEIAQSLAQLYAGNKDQLEKQIQTQKRAAVLAEKSDIASAYRSWLLLARTEVDAKKAEQAIAHVEHALDLFRKHAKKVSNFNPLLTNKENSIVEVLRKQRQSAQAEHLLQVAANATQIIYGDDSVEYSLSLAELACFYADAQDYREVLRLVEKILHSYSTHDAQLPPNSHSHVHGAIRRLYEISAQLAQQGEFEKAVNIDSEILTIQKSKLPSNNAQIADTLFALGTLYKNSDQFEKAEPLYRETIERMNEHWGDSRITRFYLGEYAEVLRKLGKTAEAERLLTVQSNAVKVRTQAAFSQGKIESDARRLEAKKETEKARELLEHAYELAKQEAPYGSSTIRALESLAKFFTRQKNNKEAEQINRKLVALFDAGASGMPRQKTKCLLSLAKIYIAQGHIENAAEHIAKAKKSDPELLADKPSFQCLLTYAEFEIEIRQTGEASKHLDLAEQRLREQSQNSSSADLTYLPIIATLWRKLGREHKAEAAEARVSKLKEREQRPERRPLTLETPADTGRSSDSSAVLDFGPYMADLERRIKRAWFPPKGAEKKEIQVIFQIHKVGEITNLRLSRSSGLAVADQSALKAIQNAAPFRPLPPGANDTETFEFTFDYQTFSGSGDGAVRRL